MTERGFFRWLRPWIFPAVLIGAFEWYARRAAVPWVAIGEMLQVGRVVLGSVIMGQETQIDVAADVVPVQRNP